MSVTEFRAKDPAGGLKFSIVVTVIRQYLERSIVAQMV